MAVTAVQLLTEFGKRIGDFYPSQPTSNTGITTQLIDTALNQYFPQAIGTATAFWNAWWYCVSGDSSNIGKTLRAASWTASTSLAGFYTGWPAAPTSTGVYEVHPRWQRDRKLEALNDAVGELGLSFYRPFVDTSITTAQATWQYTLPSSQSIFAVNQVEIEINTNDTNIGFPYQDASMYDWHFWSTTDTSGVETQIVQFGVLPPYPRTLRVRGLAYVPDLVNDTDILPVAGGWARAALSFIYKWAEAVITDWGANRVPAGQSDRYRQQWMDALMDAKQKVQAAMPSPPPAQIVTPLQGRGLYKPFGGSNNPDFATILHIGG